LIGNISADSYSAREKVLKIESLFDMIMSDLG